MRRIARHVLLVALGLTVVPAAVFAQSAIAGVVKDDSGAVLPGVTVEASSAALIEKARTVATDERGQYKIIDLRPGVYTVTFTLPGFSTVRREGIELTANFTASVNAEMKVGTVEETVTVTGESPVVDVLTVTERTVMTRETLDAVPTGRNIQAVGILIPGTSLQVGGGGALSIDVGGSGGMQQSPLTYHGTNDSVQQVNGIRYNNFDGSGQYAGTYWNDGMFEEISYVTSADSAENGQGGVRINMVPKSGGNTFRGTVFTNFSTDAWQGNNLDGKLRARGAKSVTELERIWDVNPSVGGPIKRDTLWFHATYRHWGVNRRAAGSFSEIDPTKQGVDDGHIQSRVINLTWQASGKNKITGYFDSNQKVRGHWGINSLVSPEASAIEDTPVSYTTQAKWFSTISNKLLVEAGFGVYNQIFREIYRPEPENPTTADVLRTNPVDGFVYRPFYATQELRSGQWLGSFRQFAVDHHSVNYQLGGAVSYVTGTHALKVGASLGWGPRSTKTNARGDIIVRYLDGRPNSVILQATPRDQREYINADLGLYVQDKWTIERATLNLGLRFDYFNSKVPPQDAPAGAFVPAREFAAVRNVPKWYDLSPRLGLSYDLFGDSKTALKVGFSRFVNGVTAGFAAANNPFATAGGNTDLRTWNDANGDRNPDPAEFGPPGNRNFGQAVFTTRFDDDVRQGWGARGYNWELLAAVQREVVPRVSAEFSFHRRWINGTGGTGSRFLTTDNLLRTPADFDPFCVNVPNDPRLPNAGQQLCGFFDVNPAKRPLVDNAQTFSSTFGRRSATYTGLDATVNARLRNGALLGGGVTSGRTALEDCAVVDNPAFDIGGGVIGPRDRDCRQTPPFRPQYKLFWAYSLPLDLQLSGTFQSVPGPEIQANLVVNSASVIGLGRPLSAGSAVVALIKPNTRFDERMYQWDFRLSRLFRAGAFRLRLMADLYNAFNNNAAVRRAAGDRFGINWNRPDQTLEPRFIKLGAQFDF